MPADSTLAVVAVIRADIIHRLVSTLGYRQPRRLVIPVNLQTNEGMKDTKLLL